MGLLSKSNRDKAADAVDREASRQTGERAAVTRTAAEHMRAGRIASYTTEDGRIIEP